MEVRPSLLGGGGVMLLSAGSQASWGASLSQPFALDLLAVLGQVTSCLSAWFPQLDGFL